VSRRDYYAILGVPKGAPPDEIRKAYRALARRFHPDHNPDDENAAERFHQITEAYQTLNDTAQRSQYDRMGALYRPDGQPPTAEDLGQFFSQAIGGIFRRSTNDVRGSDIEQNLHITLEELSTGIEKNVSFQRECKCDSCSGSGATFDGKEDCGVCTGTGTSTGRLFRSRCNRCDGKGFVVTKRCKRCGGNGRIFREEAVKIQVPIGIQVGQRLRIRNAGNDSLGDADTGDFFAIVQIDEHILFRRRGNDLFCDAPLMWTEATLGCELTVPTLEGTTTIRIPSHTQSHQIFRLAGRGLPSFDGKFRGDLHIRVMIETPNKINSSQRSILNKLHSHGTTMHEKRAKFDEHLQHRSKS
jgi:molecular chaperone DnaJ